jgi:hypothetical protein
MTVHNDHRNLPVGGVNGRGVIGTSRSLDIIRSKDFDLGRETGLG